MSNANGSSDPAGASTSPATIGETVPDSDAAAMLEALEARRDEVELVALAAVAKATNECLAPFGFTYDDGFDPATEVTLPPPHYPWSAPLPEGSEQEPELIDEGEIFEEPLDPSYDAALYGSIVGQWGSDTTGPDGPDFAGQPLGGDVYDGCLPTAEREIIGGGVVERGSRLIDLEYLINDVVGQALSGLLSDEDFRRAAEVWKQCMADHGVDDDIFEGGDDDREDYPEFDAQCLQSSGLTELGDRLFQKYKDEAFARLIGDPTEIMNELDEILARANAVLE